MIAAPLLESAMNQNGTHQASVFYLLADYALGVGIFAALPGTYTVGVHDRCPALPIQFWLKSGEVRHLRPGTGTISAEVEFSDDQARTMRMALFRKGRFTFKHRVAFFQGGQLVAEGTHEMGVFADTPRVDGQAATFTQVHNVKTSGLMIAGVREDEQSRISLSSVCRKWSVVVGSAVDHASLTGSSALHNLTCNSGPDTRFSRNVYMDVAYMHSSSDGSGFPLGSAHESGRGAGRTG